MNPKVQVECLDDNCRTVLVERNSNRLDGIRCIRCDGPVEIRPFKLSKPKPSERALYVRKSILWENKEHCFKLTDEQIETVLALGDDYEKQGLELF